MFLFYLRFINEKMTNTKLDVSSLMLSTNERRAMLFGNIGLYDERYIKKLQSLPKIQQVLCAKIALLDTERSYKNITDWERGLNPTLRMLRPVREDHDFVCEAKYDAAVNYIQVLESLLPEHIREQLRPSAMTLPKIDRTIVFNRYNKILQTGLP